MQDATPPVSVYMPAYNVGPFVRQAIDSILNQTFTDFEFIIIDDGSTDDTLAILKEYEAADARIRVVSRPNVGVAATANEAIALARGEFLARIDGDDVAMPNRLQLQVDFLRQHPRCAAVGGGVLLMDLDGMPLYPMPDIAFGHEKIDAALLTGGWPIVQGVSLFRKSAVDAVGRYNVNYSLHEDHDLFLRLGEIGELENLPDVLLHYRRHLRSVTFSEAASSRAVVAAILKDARRRRGLNGPAEEADLPVPGAADMDLLSRCRHWAWMSLKSQYVATARKYARKSVRLAPFSPDSWRLMYCAWRGR